MVVQSSRYEFKLKPYKHQVDALGLSWNKEEFALFCEMGTGKSKILIDNIGILYERGEINAAVIVAPKGVYKNWQRTEIPRHMPDRILEKTDVIAWDPNPNKSQKNELEQALNKSDRLKILVINTEAFSTPKGSDYAMKFVTHNKSLMAIDESTTIKNRSAARTKSIIKVGSHAAFRRIMTGSPVTKSPMDLYSQCTFLGGNILGYSSFFAFQSRYAKMFRRSVGSHSFNQIVGYQNLGELTEKLDKFSYRVLKKDCLDLPEKVYIKRTVEMSDEQASLYGQLKRNAYALLTGADKKTGTVSAANVLTQILRLQQVCSGSVTSDTGEVIRVKSYKLDELLSVIDETEGKIIIWAIFRDDILKITEVLKKEFGNTSAAAYFGDTEAEERQNIVNSFQDPNSDLRFFVGNPKTGGYGLTLTEASTVVYYNNLYDLEVRLQSEDRAHRIGQKNNVTYIDLVTENTVEEKILKALRDKIDIATLVLNEDYKEWLL